MTQTPKKLQGHILLVDDEVTTCESVAYFLRRKGCDVATAHSGNDAILMLNEQHFDMVFTDLRMNHGDGFAVLEKCNQTIPPTPCVVQTAYGEIQTAVKATKLGAYDFLEKPVNLDRFEILVKRILEENRLKTENKTLKKKLNQELLKNDTIGNSLVIRKTLEMIRQVAPTKTTILITGESGTGKELAAELVHRYSGVTGSFLPVHCAAIPENLLESELFGYEKGAFTGANEQKKGFFETAMDGTLFLDEIGEISPSIQVKLLRVLENQTFNRVGGTTPIKTTARIVAATNRDLAQMVKEGTFREDLYFRLNIIDIHLPALREREEDIPLITRYWLDRIAQQNQRGHITITEDAMQALMRYDWPGNIRELRNVLERMVVLSREDELTLDNVPIKIRGSQRPSIKGVKRLHASEKLDIEKNERELIIEALHACKGNRTRAAEKLGISRRTLHRKLSEYEINL